MFILKWIFKILGFIAVALLISYFSPFSCIGCIF